MSSIPKFFLGSNTQTSFVSYFSQLTDFQNDLQLMILKGGPGSGKSTLMKKVLSYALEKGHRVEIIPCASDPKSIDAVIDCSAKFAIMDGTSPHALDPDLPGARQHIIYTGDMWDTTKLSKNAESISDLTCAVSDCHRGACAYIKGAASLISYNSSFSGRYISKKKANSFITEITTHLNGADAFKESKRLLSAVSVGKIELFSDTVSFYADKIFIISDRFGGCADYILDKIHSFAVLNGERTIFCPCSLNSDKCDHLIFPDSRVAVLKENDFLKFPFPEARRLEATYPAMPMVQHLDKNLKNASILLSEASRLISDAKFLHDELEAFYISAMDFEKAGELFLDIQTRFY